ncbi:MAG: bacillithiol biosynthesis protein BshC, partial [Candidatus Binatia bacterium]
PLSFFHPDGAAGPRYRLAPAAGGFALVGEARHYTRAALLDTLATAPLQFSTSALLRPILQDTLLPTAAYVGGPGEVAYFAQLAPLYAAYGLAMPLVVPRARLRVVDDKTAQLLARLRLTADDVQRPEDVLLAMARPDAPPAAAVEQRLLAPFAATLAALSTELAPLGGGVPGALEKTRATVESALIRLAGKIEQARLHQDAALVADVRRLRRLLFPNETPQERVYGLASFAARHGERRFVDAVLAAVRPFDPTPRDLGFAAEVAP